MIGFDIDEIMRLSFDDLVFFYLLIKIDKIDCFTRFVTLEEIKILLESEF